MSKEILITSSFNLEDFKDLKYAVVLKNLSSGTQVDDPRKTSIIELRPKGLVLEVPLNSCNKGHDLNLFIFSYPLRKKSYKPPVKGAWK